MGADTKIEWTDHTFNPWVGCTKVAPGCANCYAERDFDKRRHFAQWGPNGTRVVTSESNWAKPLKWNREAEAAGVRSRVFCASLADVFEDWNGPILESHGDTLFVCECGNKDGARTELETPECSAGSGSRMRRLTLDDLRCRLFALIDATPWLDWQLVTKRPQNLLKMWHSPKCPNCDEISCTPHKTGVLSAAYRPNVWLLTSVSDQTTADAMIPPLLECRDLVPVLGLSIEPLLGPVDLTEWLYDNCCSGLREHFDMNGEYIGSEPCQCQGGPIPTPRLDWVIVGGESGPGARPMHPQWVRSLRDQCQAAGVPFFFKQWGEWEPMMSAESWIDGMRDCESDAEYRSMARNVVFVYPDGNVVPAPATHDAGELWDAGEPFIECDGDHMDYMNNGPVALHKVGKKTAGRLLDGVAWDQFPE